MALVVKKVQVRGANFHGMRTAMGREAGKETIAFLKGKGVKAVAQVVKDGVPGEIELRLDDMPAGMLTHTLLQDFANPGFVQPKDMKLVCQTLEGIPQAIERFTPKTEAPIDWAKLPFDLNFPEKTIMLVASLTHTLDAKKHTIRGSWTNQVPDIEMQLFPFSDVLESPATQVKHYGQAGFEGMKCYRAPDGKIIGFRWEENAKRLQRTVRRLGMTPAPVDFYLEAIRTAVLANKDLVPPPGLGAAMYIRPVQYGSGPRLGVKEAGVETLIVFVSPVGPYYQAGFKPIDIMTPSSNIRRSGTGLTGGVKSAGNYVMGLIELILAKEKGFNEVLWVRPHRGKLYPEEIGSSNLFYVIDGEIFTPELTDTILPGITRDSVIKLARAIGMRAHEVEMPLCEVLEKSSEVFCTGTAAVITPVGSITDNTDRTAKKRKVFDEGKVGKNTKRLYDALVSLQEGRFNDPALNGIRPDLLEEFKADWIYEVER